MSTNYTGDPTAVSNALVASIIGATNASPIVVQTGAAHGFSTGDTVDVAGVGGNTAANGEWTIVKVDATHFSLTGSTGSGAYTSGGTATDVSLTPGTVVPSDGDDETGASVATPFELALNRTQFLNQRIGAFKLISMANAPVSLSVGNNAVAAAAVLTVGISLKVGDLVEVLFTGSLTIGDTASPSYPLQVNPLVGVQVTENGGSPINLLSGGGQAKVLLASSAENNGAGWPLTAAALRTVVTAGTFQVNVIGETGPSGYVLGYAGQAVVKVWRSN